MSMAGALEVELKDFGESLVLIKRETRDAGLGVTMSEAAPGYLNLGPYALLQLLNIDSRFRRMHFTLPPFLQLS